MVMLQDSIGGNIIINVCAIKLDDIMELICEDILKLYSSDVGKFRPDCIFVVPLNTN